MTPPSPPTSEKRKRGAQPGNLNARKHGLTPRPKPPEYRTEKLTQVDLTAEIHILRQQLVRLNDAALQASSLAETVEIARVIAQTASALARLIRAQVVVFSADTSETSLLQEWEDAVSQALTDVHDELFVDSPNYHPPTQEELEERSRPVVHSDAWDRYTDLITNPPPEAVRRLKRSDTS